MFIINKVERNVIEYGLQYAYILILACYIHVEMCNIFHPVFPFLFHTGIFRHYYTDIILRFVKFFRERADNIGKSSCLDKRDTL